MAEKQKEKGKSDVEQISDEQRKKLLAEQAREKGPAIKNEKPPKPKSKEELVKEVGKEASKVEDFARELENVVGMPTPKGGWQKVSPSPPKEKPAAPKVLEPKAEKEEIPKPPSYPIEENDLYRKSALADPKLDKQQFSGLVKDMSALPLDFDKEGIKALPGLTKEQGEMVFKEYLSKTKDRDPVGLERESTRFNEAMKFLANKYPEAFVPVDGIKLASGEQVLIGSPISFMRGYTGVPIYIKQGDRTQMIMAYRSGSQGCWRRFAGTDYGTGSLEENGLEIPTLSSHYFKGERGELGNEAWQNLDHRIQKRVDMVVKGRRPLDLTKNVSITAFHVKGRGGNEGLVPANEEALQLSMLNGAKTWSIKSPGTEPDLTRVISYWPATGNPLYRNQVNAVVESKNGEFRYGISLTPFGVFVQYIEDNTDRGVNRGGSPSKGVKLSKASEWILTPVVEYEQQQSINKPGQIMLHEPRKGRRLPTGEEHLIGKGRIIFDNLHTEGSPFSGFSNANPKLAKVYGALMAGDVDDAHAEFGKWMQLPPKERI